MLAQGEHQTTKRFENPKRGEGVQTSENRKFPCKKVISDQKGGSRTRAPPLYLPMDMSEVDTGISVYVPVGLELAVN